MRIYIYVASLKLVEQSKNVNSSVNNDGSFFVIQKEELDTFVID